VRSVPPHVSRCNYKLKSLVACFQQFIAFNTPVIVVKADTLLPEKDPAFTMGHYPRELFDQWAEIIWTVDDDGSLLLLCYSPSAEKRALHPYDPSSMFLKLGDIAQVRPRLPGSRNRVL
jgi:hypothetical protein